MKILRVLFYCSCFIFFLAFLHIRYNNVMPGNGILMGVPGFIGLASLIVSTLISILKHKKDNYRTILIPWGVLFSTILIMFLLVKYL